MTVKPALLWFQQDLRLTDNPALEAAVRAGPVIPLFIWSPGEDGPWPLGGAARWWLHRSLESLDADLRKKNGRLVLRRGPVLECLKKIVRETGARSVYWNRRYEPSAVARDNDLKEKLKTERVDAESFNGSLLFDPSRIRNRSGDPYQVFTAFWRYCRALPDPLPPRPVPVKIPWPATWPASDTLAYWRLLPGIPWHRAMEKEWSPGESGARKKLDRFLREALESYTEGRDRPSEVATSRLSPHLHFGEVGPRQVWHAVSSRIAGKNVRASLGAGAHLRQLIWREFAHYLLFHFPCTDLRPLREKFGRFPWARESRLLKAWRKGRTGYPLVDAGMRELWSTGWMHNRVRMVVGSFLVKDLLLPWQEGARWFWDTLVDADLANNTLGWQWVAGCGADAAPYFRIFNPVSQSETFDPAGEYIRRWVPELASLPSEWIHRPWLAPPDVLKKSGVDIGGTYPAPIVDHGMARARALRAFRKMNDRTKTFQ